MKKALTLFCFLALSKAAFSQVLYPEVYSCFGGHATGSSVQLTWTAGEPLYETATDGNSILTQGFNQVQYFFSTDIGNDVVEDKFKVYPNPCRGSFWVDFISEKEYKTLLKVYDLSGVLLLACPLNSPRKEISLQHLTSGLYIIKILDPQDNLLESGKICKTLNTNKILSHENPINCH